MKISEPKLAPEPLSKRKVSVQRSMPLAALNDVIAPGHRWLSPKTLAALFDLDEKWLEDARGGRKEVDGPPFQKLGNANNSPVRYNLALALEWMQRFPSIVNTAGKSFSQFQSLGDFLRVRSPSEPWLFGWHGDQLLDVIGLLNGGLLDDEHEISLGWLAFPEWLLLCVNDARMGDDLRVAIDRTAGHALALYERQLIEATSNKRKSGQGKEGGGAGSV